jgi:hypothetical protein
MPDLTAWLVACAVPSTINGTARLLFTALFHPSPHQVIVFTPVEHSDDLFPLLPALMRQVKNAFASFDARNDAGERNRSGGFSVIWLRIHLIIPPSRLRSARPLAVNRFSI